MHSVLFVFACNRVNVSVDITGFVSARVEFFIEIDANPGNHYKYDVSKCIGPVIDD